MADSERFAAIKRYIRAYTAEHSSTRESARRALISEGIYTKEGALRPEFGGPKPARPASASKAAAKPAAASKGGKAAAKPAVAKPAVAKTAVAKTAAAKPAAKSPAKAPLAKAKGKSVA
ncbi:hypothetical protein [Xanthobacter pseudotagetidis]|uniref:hypothetical protein n=1 Tax=Xanthobacter pseudotagetidis TaxID=3119911 RepID=UPI003727E902